MSRERVNTWARRLFGACAIWMVGLGLYFIAVRPPLLPEDVRFMGASQDAIAALPGMKVWLGRVFTVMGGFMAASGLLLVAAGKRPGENWAVLLAAGATSVGLMSAVNFMIGSDFKWLLLAPVVLWAVAIALASRLRTEAGTR